MGMRRDSIHARGRGEEVRLGVIVLDSSVLIWTVYRYELID